MPRTFTFFQIVLVALLLPITDAFAENTYPWDQAHQHIGENATVEGTITYSNNTGKMCFLNFNPNFEKYISVVIFRDYFPLFPKSPEIYYYLKNVRVHGKITKYKGKAQIKVYSPKQIEVVGEHQRKESYPPCSCNLPKQLQITVVNIGQGDATIIATPTKIMLVDAGESYWYSNADALKIDAVLREKYGEDCRCIDYVLITHFHLDHIGYIFLPEDLDDNPLNSRLGRLKPGDTPYKPMGYGGLAYLVLEKGYQIGKMIVRDYRHHNPNKEPKDGGSKTFRNWQLMLESAQGLKRFAPEIVKLGKNQIRLGSIGDLPVVVDVVSADGATPSHPDGCDPGAFFGGPNYVVRGDRSKDKLPPSENDLSIALVVSFGEFQMFIGGDLSGENHESEYGYRYHDMEQCLSNDPYFIDAYRQGIEILRANHHGSSHSSNEGFMRLLQPTITIFSVGDHNGYGHVACPVLERARKFSKAVYLTECGETVRSKAEADAKGVVVVDNEYPETVEENEAGDANIDIRVSTDGKKYIVQGIQYSTKEIGD